MTTTIGPNGVAEPERVAAPAEPAPPPAVRTVLRMLVRQGREQEFTDAWREAADVIATVPGQVRQELMREAGGRWFSIVSDWTSREAVDAFGRSAARERLTEALRDLREDAARSTHEVLAAVPARPQHPVRVEITTTAAVGEGEDLEEAWLAVAPHIQAARGNVLESLVRSSGVGAAGASEYRISSEWTGEDDFGRWLADPDHAAHGAPMGRWYARDFRKEVLHVRQGDLRDASFVPVGDAEEPVRVELTASVPADDHDELERCWRAVADHVRHHDGNLLEELLRSDDGATYRVCSEWRSADHHARSLDDPDHAALVAPLLRWFEGSEQRTYALRQVSVRDGSYRDLAPVIAAEPATAAAQPIAAA